MKIFFAIMLAMFFVFLASCGGGSENPPSMQTPAPPLAPVYHPATYALEEMGARYAHSRGFRGEGVTILVNYEHSVRNTHRDLSPNIITLAPGGNVWDISDDARHGTGSAGLMVAVAPSVRLLFPAAGNAGNAYRNARSSGAQIIMSNGEAGTFGTGLQQTAPLAEIRVNRLVMERATEYSDALGDSDIVQVNPTFNDGYNSVQGMINAPKFEGAYPHIRSDLADNWLMATALNRNTVIANYLGSQGANGCGYARMWCVAAFGDRAGHRTTDSDSDTDYTNFYSGTSAAAPHVAGALAVLKSAAPPGMPMTMIRAILLDTATDLTPDDGQRQDAVYGWGLVNISAGIVSIANMETAGGTLLRDLRGRLPAEFSHLRGRMDSVSVAVKITEDSFYNLALGSLLSSADGGESSSAKIGGAAKGIMADSALRYRGASAFGDSENGFGFRYGGGDDSFFYTAEFSRGARREGFAGSDFGALGSVSSRTHGGKVRLNSQVGGGFSAFGEYEYEDISANVGGGGLIAEIRGAKSDGWTAGLEYADMFSFGDRLHFALREETRISGGEMILEYPHADGDFYEAFLGEREQTIRTVRTAIPLKQRRTHIWTAGYGRDYDGGGFAAAAEWNARSGDKAISAEWRIDL